MIVVIFEFEPDTTKKGRYFELAETLSDEVQKIQGFVSVERFESVHDRNDFVSISTWENMGAVQQWKEHLRHATAQEEAKGSNIFKHYRIRVAEVVRDYGTG